MASWAPSNPKFNYKAVIGNESLMGLTVSQKSIGLDLMQNCDLPPPLKVFTGSDKAVLSSMNRIRSIMGKEDHDHQDHEFNMYRCDHHEEDDNLRLLKALRLSQTRAREAEKKAATLALERECLSNALLEEAGKLFGYRQWVKFLELQISKLNSKWVRQEKHYCFSCEKSKGVKAIKEKRDDDEGGDSISWMLALTLCLGIAGVGFVFGCRFLLF